VDRRRSGAFAADANAAHVSSKPTGNAGLDDYCRQAADLINDAFAASARLEPDHLDESRAATSR
jgi:hypothetical protein